MRALVTIVLAGGIGLSAAAAAEKDQPAGVDQGSVYSVRPEADLAACIAQDAGVSSSGSDPTVVTVVRPDDTITYSVGELSGKRRKESAYRTEVLISSDFAHRDQFLRVLACARDPRLIVPTAR